MADTHAEIRLSREMRLIDVTLIGVGAMIGAGIFVLTGIAAGVAGPALILAFALNGVATLFTALSYAELGSCFHDAGGGYLWVKNGLPDPNGFLSGWMSWFAHAVACSLYALGFGAYFQLVLGLLGYQPGEGWPISPEKLLATLVVVLFCYINYRGASETGKAGNIVTIAKIVVLAVFIGAGMFAMYHRPDWTEHFEDFMPNGWGGVFMAMGLTFIAFEGYEIIAQCSEEVQDPRRNIPRAIFYSLAIVVPIYLLVAWVALGAIDGGGIPTWKYLAQKKEIAMVEAAKQFFAGGGVMLLVGGLLSTLSALNATIFSSSRVSFAMARDHNLPDFFAKLSARRKTPHVSILFSMVIIIAMLLWLPIEDVAAAADIMFMFLFLQVNVTLIRLRRIRPDLDRGFSVPFVPVVPVLGIITEVGLLIWMFIYSPVACVSAILWIGGGYLLHRFYAAPKEQAALKRIASFARMDRKEYRVLAAISSARTASSIIEVALAVAHKHGGELLCLSVVEVPEDHPLRAGLERTSTPQSLVNEGVRRGDEAGVSSRGLIKVSHRVSLGIVETAKEEACNFIVMGRSRSSSFLDGVFAARLDSVVRGTSCDVALVGGTVRRGVVRRLVLPLTGGRHPQFAAELAQALSEWFDAGVRPLTIVPTSTALEVAQRMRDQARVIVEGAGLESRLAMVRGDDLAGAILQQCEGGDLVLMGGDTGGALSQLISHSLPLEILERRSAPVVIARKYETTKRGWLEKLLMPR